MKILVTGARGMLGTALCHELSNQPHQVISTDLNIELKANSLRMDICDFESVRRIIEQEKPEFIFHLAAETDVDQCEQNHDHAFRVNTLGVENLALLSQRQDIPMVYISTAGVFDGTKKEPYTEFDAPNPINVYGKSKLQGEAVVQRLLKRYFIFRAGWMVGGLEIDKKFVFKIIKQIQEGKRHLLAVHDKLGCPTFTQDFARNMMEVVQTNRWGLYHLCGKGSCSRYEMAVKIVECMGLSGKVQVEPISSSHFPLPAHRPDSEVMRNLKLDLLALNHMPYWEEALGRYIRTYLDTASIAPLLAR